MTAPPVNTMDLRLTRRYPFSASHRLHSAQLSEEENQLAYGRCNNPFGHGHNYVVEVAVSGPVDPATGMIANPADLDGFIAQEVIERFDRTYLNEEVAEFRDTVPTTENLCIEIFRRLRAFPHAKLERVLVEETGLNKFEYFGETQGSQS